MNSLHAWIISFGPYLSTHNRSKYQKWTELLQFFANCMSGCVSMVILAFLNNKKGTKLHRNSMNHVFREKYIILQGTNRFHLGKFGTSSFLKNAFFLAWGYAGSQEGRLNPHHQNQQTRCDQVAVLPPIFVLLPPGISIASPTVQRLAEKYVQKGKWQGMQKRNGIDKIWPNSWYTLISLFLFVPVMMVLWYAFQVVH